MVIFFYELRDMIIVKSQYQYYFYLIYHFFKIYILFDLFGFMFENNYRMLRAVLNSNYHYLLESRPESKP